MREFIVSTPSGRRVLCDIGGNFVMIRPVFEPVSKRSDERLQFGSFYDVPKAAPDGVWIGPRHLWTVSVGLASRSKAPITGVKIGELLFFEVYRPDIRRIFDKLMTTYDPTDSWWQAMSKHSWYDQVTGTVHHIPCSIQ